MPESVIDEIRKEARCIASLSRHMHLSPSTVRIVGESIHERALRILKITEPVTGKISEHDMLVTLATQALSLSDLHNHDVLESLRALGYGHIIVEASEK